MRFAPLRTFSSLVFLPFGLPLWLVLWSALCQAAAYPNLDNQNTQIISLEDGAVDIAVRVAAINRAQHSVEFAAYAQGFDSGVGAQYVKAVRDAAIRGVSGRFVYDGFVSRYQDLTANAAKLLNGENMDVMSICPLKKMLCGLTPTDFFHGKILIIDRGTPNEVIFVGGRNNDKFAKDWHDYAIAIRPIDPSKPYLGTQLRELFDENWDTAKKIQKKHSNAKPSVKALADIDNIPSAPETLSASGLSTFKEIDGLLSKPPSATTSSPLVFKPDGVRTLSNDFMESALSGDHGKSIESRQETMRSDITRGVVEAIHKAKRVTISSMLPWFSPELNEALDGVVARKGDVVLFTNGKEAQAPTKGYGYKFVLPQLDHMTQLPGADEHVRIYGFQPGSTLPDGNGHPLEFSHLKKVVVEQEDGTILSFVGSDNMNQLGTTKNEELMVEINSREYGNYVLQKLGRDAETMYHEIPHSEIQQDAAEKVGLFTRCVLLYMRHLF